MIDRMVANELREARHVLHFDAGYRAGVEAVVTRLFSSEAVARATRSYGASDRSDSEDAMTVALAEALGATELLIESGPGPAHGQDSTA